MTAAVIYALSVDPESAEVNGAASFEVLSRQLPRLAVHLLNREVDRGIRFFPLIGRQGEQRRFFVVDEMLSVPTLLELHGQKPAPRMLVDGCLYDDGLRLRIHDAEGRSLFDERIPFEVQQPLPAVSRMMFELTGALGWTGAPPRVPELEGEGLSSYLVARDNLLALEAEVLDSGPESCVSSALHALSRAPREVEVHRVAIDIFSRIVELGDDGSTVVGAVEEACELVDGAGDGARFLSSAAALLESCGDGPRALRQYERAAQLEPTCDDAVCRAATMYFDARRFEDAQRLLRRAVTAGQRSPTVLAQLAVIEQQLGNEGVYGELMEELLGTPQLRSPVVRLLVTYLLDRGRSQDALAQIEDCLEREPDSPSPWYDKGRALLASGRGEEAAVAFAQCQQLGPPEPLAREVERQLRFAHQPEVLVQMRELDERLAHGDLRGALRLARRLVRSQRELPEAWLFLGVTLQRLGRPRRAERALRRTLDLQPDLGEAHNRIGILLVARGRDRHGYVHLREAVRLLPHEPSAHLHFAQACHRTGRLMEGRQALEAARRLGAAQDLLDEIEQMLESPPPDE